MDEDRPSTALSREELEKKLQAPDAVMETQAPKWAASFVDQNFGTPEQTLDHLAAGYSAKPQLCGMMADWLSDLHGGSREAADEVYENAAGTLVRRHFAPNHADQIFEVEAASGIEWLPRLIQHRRWRQVVYELMERHPSCLMLNLAVKLISDAGHQHEISSVVTAAQQLEIFTRVLLSTLETAAADASDGGAGAQGEAFQRTIAELVRVACHSEHTYVFTSALLRTLARTEAGRPSAALAAHLQNRLREAVAAGHEVETAAIDAALAIGGGSGTRPSSGSNAADGLQTGALLASLQGMQARRALNPADITLVYQHYIEPRPPPVDLLRSPVLLSLLLDALFLHSEPGGSWVAEEHRPKYIYLLAYAASVVDVVRDGQRAVVRGELEQTREALGRAVGLLLTPAAGAIGAELGELLKLIQRWAVCAAGAVRAAGAQLLETAGTAGGASTPPSPTLLVILDAAAAAHPPLRPRVHQIALDFYARVAAAPEAAELVMERQRLALDRMVHLLCVGYALPVIEAIAKCVREQTIDVSLVRYFVLEVLDCIAPPYSPELAKALLPLVADPDIFEPATAKDRAPTAHAFVDHCRSTFPELETKPENVSQEGRRRSTGSQKS